MELRRRSHCVGGDHLLPSPTGPSVAFSSVIFLFCFGTRWWCLYWVPHSILSKAVSRYKSKLIPENFFICFNSLLKETLGIRHFPFTAISLKKKNRKAVAGCQAMEPHKYPRAEPSCCWSNSSSPCLRNVRELPETLQSVCLQFPAYHLHAWLHHQQVAGFPQPLSVWQAWVPAYHHTLNLTASEKVAAVAARYCSEPFGSSTEIPPCALLRSSPSLWTGDFLQRPCLKECLLEPKCIL